MKRVMSLLGAMLLFCTTTSVQAQDRAALGVTLSDQSSGAVVTSITAGSPAAQAGLMPGDQIVAINREPVSSYNDVLRIVAASTPGSQSSVDVLRGTTRISLSATLSGAAQVFPASVVSVKTSAWSNPVLQCSTSGGGCVQTYYRPHYHRYFNRSYSCGRSYCGGYHYRHHGCYSGCR